MCDHRLADSPEPHFDDFLALEHLQGLITERVAEQHAELVRLSPAEVTLCAAIVPSDRSRFFLNSRSRRALREVPQNRQKPVRPVEIDKRGGFPRRNSRRAMPETVLGPQRDGEIAEPRLERIPRPSAH